MEYPLISEYREAILSAEDNFNELASLRPVLDSHGDPVMSSGNFAVVFKMRDENNGKLYAVKCFIKDQEGRDESYRKIADELENVSSSYILPLRYLENELFVDSEQCDREEFPVVVMEWVEGETLDAYLNRNLNDKYELEMLSYRFNRMAAWLLAQPFAHGDLKPDNILVRKDGSLVLVDYDGMYVPSMKGERAREIGSPDYRHPSRTDADFDEHIDDFAIAVIALSLKAISLNSQLKSSAYSSDSLLLSKKDYHNPSSSETLKEIISFSSNSDLCLLLGAFFLVLSKNSLSLISLNLFKTNKTDFPVIENTTSSHEFETIVKEEDINNGVIDDYGVIYSKDGLRLLRSINEDIKEYCIKNGTKIICDEAFSVCLNLTTIHLPATVKIIGNSVFRNCNLKYINIPASIVHMGRNPFPLCYHLKIDLDLNSNYHIFDGLLIDKKGVLISCNNIIPDIIIPKSVTSIGDEAFFASASLFKVVIPDSVKSIGKRAFLGCEYLRSIIIPDSVETIDQEAFYNCMELTDITMSESISYIGNKAFWMCKSLKKIVFKYPTRAGVFGLNPFGFCSKLSIDFSPFTNYYVQDGLIIDMHGKLISCISRSSKIILPLTITSIEEKAFYSCQTLQSLVIPESVTEIGSEAFAFCESLKSVKIPKSVVSIGDKTFYNCKSLSEVVIPESVTEIGSEAFAFCKSLKSAMVCATIDSIRDKTFINCESLQSIIIPKSVTTIGEQAFASCESIHSINLPLSIKTIGKSAFYKCFSLRKINLPNSITLISNGTFKECVRLSNIIIPESVKTIGDCAFEKCLSLYSIHIPNSVKLIGICAFWECKSLKTVFLPRSIKFSIYSFPSQCQIIQK